MVSDLSRRSFVLKCYMKVTTTGGMTKPWNQFHGTVFDMNKRVLQDSMPLRVAPTAVSDLKINKGKKNGRQWQ